MNDIVERLREVQCETEFDAATCDMAADEIEKLRAALEELYSMCLRQEDFNDDRDGLTLSRARAALQQEPQP